MLDFLKDWIINIVTISLILILFEMIIPTGKTKKIINLVSGFILLIVIINPFIALKNQNYSLSETTISDSFYIDKKEIENSSKFLRENQIKQITSVYKKKLIAKIQKETENLEGVELSKTDVEINEDYKSDNFGEIKKVYIELKKKELQTKKDLQESQEIQHIKEDSINVKPVISIKKVDVLTETKKDKTKASKQIATKTNELAELVKENINRTLEIPKDCIVVTVLDA